MRKICSPSAPIASSLGIWERLVQELQAYYLAPGQALGLLQAACEAVESTADNDAKERKRLRLESWRSWKKQQCERGGQGGALFAFIKRTEECPDLVVRCQGVKSASPQATLEQDFHLWDALWSKLKHLAERPGVPPSGMR